LNTRRCPTPGRRRFSFAVAKASHFGDTGLAFRDSFRARESKANENSWLFPHDAEEVLVLRSSHLKFLASLPVLVAALAAVPAFGQSMRPLNADSFKLGSGGGAICQVQTRSKDAALSTMFDRAWSVVCRDSARPVGRIYALRGSQAEVLARLAERRKGEANCTTSGQETLENLGNVTSWSCMLADAQVGYKVIGARKGSVYFVSEGLSAYDSALKLGLRSIAEDRILPGQISVVTTSVDDPVAFARVQAGSLDADKAMAEGYRRNNAGNYAEAAEFFDTLQQRITGSVDSADLRNEYLVNQALQKSNLGDFAEADGLFDEMNKISTNDRVQVRLRRNYAALHLLNQQKYDEALLRIREPVAPLPPQVKLPGSAIEIGAQVAAEINSGLPVGQRLGATDIATLTPDERARFLDAQALGVEGTVLRLLGKPADGRQRLEQALTDMLDIRNGRVVSIIRMRAQVEAEIGLALEDEGNLAGAEARLSDAVALLQTRYPQTAAVNGALARLAAFHARHGNTQAALSGYRTIVASAIANQSPTTGMGNLLNPYFQLLTTDALSTTEQAGELLMASQTLIRPGVADTQAVLARELSESDTDASRLFRQSRSLSREIERSRIELASLVSQVNQTADIKAAIGTIQNDIAALEKQQVATQGLLAGYSQFRAITNKTVTLAELQGSLRDQEAYVKMLVAGPSVYVVHVDKSGARAWRASIKADEMQAQVDLIRDTIAKDENGQIVTYPFDIAAARNLYVALFGPVSDQLQSAHHIIFEPDGAMLQLPLNLLVADQASVDRYDAAQKRPGADEYDFRGVNWIGRGREVSTAVSVRAFRDTRAIPGSKAKRQYIGMGRNDPVGEALASRGTRGAVSGAIDCSWPASLWNSPISESELNEASQTLAGKGTEVIAGTGFTDSAIKARTDLSDFRILHFATHGLVTAPRPQCPARPALVTSFGSDDSSDGLLSFKEIFELKLDADLIILSACDTAGKASKAATREAGVTTGGGSALDGLVRAFIGAGSRSVVASHWPAPDDFDATKRLISGLFKAQSGSSVGDALAQAQLGLMDQKDTSHPYYWAGFAIVGDAGRSLLSAAE